MGATPPNPRPRCARKLWIRDGALHYTPCELRPHIYHSNGAERSELEGLGHTPIHNRKVEAHGKEPLQETEGGGLEISTHGGHFGIIRDMIGIFGRIASNWIGIERTQAHYSLPTVNPKTIPDTADETESKLPTLEVLEQQRLERKKVEAQLARQAQKEKYLEAQRTQKAAAQGEQQPPAEGEHQDGAGLAADAEPGSVEALEEEAGQQGAFNPETGEINWDCPCLGGMANGPCGEEFKAAFSCFVYSTEEPKGMDCIEKFKDMQTCFRAYPDIYGAELQDQDDDDDVSSSEEHPAAASPSPIAAESDHSSSTQATRAEKVSDASSSPAPVREAQHERAEPATAQLQRQHQPLSSSENVVPKPWHDAEDKK